VKVPGANYLEMVRSLCDDHGLLLILDEVQTGIGRTGRFFAYEHYGIEPDIICIAKGLGGGVAIGAVLAKEKVASSFQHGTHASTFGGNPLACAAAIATIETLLEDGIIMDNCRRMEHYFRKALEKLRTEFPSLIAEIRGLGLLLGMELTKAGDSIVNSCLEKGVLINCTSGNVLRFTPPLTVSEREVDQLINTLEDVFEIHA
jgi:acetylornithine/succinyldiaminopimelate/putrescine aminotransferase